MNCYGTEKISLLIDGELAAEEAREAERHLEACASCRRAKEDFLTLRERLISYPPATDAASAQRALERILAAGNGAPTVERARERRAPWRGLLALPRLNPTLASAVALVVLAVAIGVIWSQSVRDSASPESVADKTPRGGVQENKDEGRQTPVPVNDNSSKRAAGEVTPSGPTGSGPDAVITVAGGRRGPDSPRRVRRNTPLVDGGRVESANNRSRSELSEDALAEFEPLFEAAGRNAAGEVVSFEHEPPVSATNDTARHFEQAQVLLRSFRNAQPEGSNAIADERQRSQRLLYRNIVLRTEATRTGNAPVARALDSLEPILIDIANLPDKPGKEDVRTIRERMQKKNIVAVLQANVAAVERVY